MKKYTVVALYADNDQPYVCFVEAANPVAAGAAAQQAAAESLALGLADDEDASELPGQCLTIISIFEGYHPDLHEQTY